MRIHGVFFLFCLSLNGCEKFRAVSLQATFFDCSSAGRGGRRETIDYMAQENEGAGRERQRDFSTRY